MRLFPTLELMDGRAVTLRAGSLDDPQIWITDPIKVAEGFAEAGAEVMQITDFDALRGDDRNFELIREIMRMVGIPVQVAGGVRSRERAEYWYDNGANSVVIGTWATQAPQQVAELSRAHPDWVVIALDICDGQLMTSGWNSQASFSPQALVEAFDPAPLAGYLFTDVSMDSSTVTSPSDGQLGLIGQLAHATKHAVTVSGAAYSLSDIARLKVMPGVSGALVSRALFNKTFSLAEALDAARPDLEPTASFQ